MTRPGPSPELVAWLTRQLIRHTDLVALAAGGEVGDLYAPTTSRGFGMGGCLVTCDRKAINVSNSPHGSATGVPWRLLADHARSGITDETRPLIEEASRVRGRHCRSFEGYNPREGLHRDPVRQAITWASYRHATDLMRAAERAVFDAADATLPAPEAEQLTLFGAST